MCGLIGLAGPAVPAYLPRVEEMLTRLHHRGPDGSGAAIGRDYILGHTRLAVQDLSQAAAQPYRAGDLTLTYNGELWNARAAAGIVPDRIIRRPKDTFQGAVGTASAAAKFGGVSHYNSVARERFAFLPKG